MVLSIMVPQFPALGSGGVPPTILMSVTGASRKVKFGLYITLTSTNLFRGSFILTVQVQGEGLQLYEYFIV